ncbi:MAG: hypothetical protein ACSHWU_13685 [Marinicella sp.]
MQGFDSGTGGTQIGGGIGSGDSGFGNFGEDGTLGIGGSGSGDPYHVAGGGGGYYGGGAAYAAGGGGGSSYIDGLSDASTISGVRPGNGLVVILATDIIYKDGFE